MKLPSVYPLTTPSSHRTSRIIPMVSSMRILRGGQCNLSAAARRSAAAACVFFLCALTADAQDSAAATAQPNEHQVADTVKFLGGGVLALALHASGHLVFDAVFAAQPRLEVFRFGPFPFFAVTHRSGLPPREEFTISSAGFWVQEVTDEWLLAAGRTRGTGG